MCFEFHECIIGIAYIQNANSAEKQVYIYAMRCEEPYKLGRF